MTDYVILKHLEDKELMCLVNAVLKDGYICIGGVSSIGDYYIQAMVKENNSL